MHATTAIHLVPGVDLGRLATHCLTCGAPIDLSQTQSVSRYATSDSVREAIIAESLGEVCACESSECVELPPGDPTLF